MVLPRLVAFSSSSVRYLQDCQNEFIEIPLNKSEPERVADANFWSENKKIKGGRLAYPFEGDEHEKENTSCCWKLV